MVEQSSIIGDIPAWFAALLALYAILHPHILNLLRRRRSHLSCEYFEYIELGYYSFGPTIGLLGLLSCHDDHITVSKLQITLTKEESGEIYNFLWYLEKPSNSAVIGTNNSHLALTEFATPLALQADSDRKFYFLCNDRETLSKMETYAKALIKEWKNYLPATPEKNDLHIKYLRFRKSDEVATNINELSQLNFWKKGQYNLDIHWISKNPEKSLSNKFHFEINDEEEIALVQNSEILCIGLTSDNSITPNFVSKKITAK